MTVSTIICCLANVQVDHFAATSQERASVAREMAENGIAAIHKCPGAIMILDCAQEMYAVRPLR